MHGAFNNQFLVKYLHAVIQRNYAKLHSICLKNNELKSKYFNYSLQMFIMQILSRNANEKLIVKQ